MRSMLRKVASDPRLVLHMVFVGTKPDIIKQAPLYRELKNRGEAVLLCHTGQHYDFENSEAILNELGMRVDINFGIEGSLTAKLSQIIAQTGDLLSRLKRLEKTIVPYVHGDTLTACGVAMGSILERIAPVHIEAGLRTVTPKAEVYKRHLREYRKGAFDYAKYHDDLMNLDNYTGGSFDPFPEQIDTRIIDAVAAIRFVPTRLNYQFLVMERGLENGTATVGNTISDAVSAALNRPFLDCQLAQCDFGGYIFFTIHRRETCRDARRFGIILDVLESLLATRRVVLIVHPMFLEGVHSCEARFTHIKQKYADKLLMIRPIPYHSDAVKVIQQCQAIVTDSGGIQEEACILGKKCVTLRYGTERIESVIEGSNILVPLADSEFATSVVDSALAEENKETNRRLYGENVAKKIVDYTLRCLKDDTGLFRTEEQRLELLCR